MKIDWISKKCYDCGTKNWVPNQTINSKNRLIRVDRYKCHSCCRVNQLWDNDIAESSSSEMLIKFATIVDGQKIKGLEKLRSGIQISYPSINNPVLEETICIKCGNKFLSEDRRRIRYCEKCRKIVNSKSHKLGLASEYVYHKKPTLDVGMSIK